MNTTTQKMSRAETSLDRLIPFAKARAFVGLSRSKIYILMASGEFPTPVKIGRNNYFSERELQAWIKLQLCSRKEGVVL